MDELENSEGIEGQNSNPDPINNPEHDPSIGVPPAEEYVPNLKYTVGDEEKDFNPRFQEFVKDKETEDYIRNLYSKSHEATTYAEKVAELQNNYQQTQSNFEDLTNAVQRTYAFMQQDLGAYLKAHKVDDRQILQLAAKIVQARKDPNIATQYNQALNQSVNNFQQNFQAQSQQQANARWQAELDSGLNDPRYQNEIASYEGRYGFGKFEEAVRRCGASRGIPPSQAIPQVIERIRLMMSAGAPANQQATQQQTPQPPQQQQPAIPNMGLGTHAGSATKTYKSIDDIRRANGIRQRRGSN